MNDSTLHALATAGQAQALAQLIGDAAPIVTSSTKRKTRDEWQMWSNYGQGWEYELSEDSWKEMRERLKEYRSNAPQYHYKAVKRRIRLA